MAQVHRLLLATALLAGPGAALADQPVCADGVCSIRLTADQLLTKASALVAEHRFAEARPMVAALAQAPGLGMETHFLSGYMAVESGDIDGAIDQFRAALSIDPKQTRVRLELARAMMLKGNRGAADYNFRLAEQDRTLPPEILATVQASRSLLRDQRTWHMTTNFGFAPDTNITNGTTAQTIDLVYGNQTIPLTLQGNAKARSGIGQTGGLSAGWRHAVSERSALLIDVDGQGVNYKGKNADDYTAQVAIGPELKFGEATTLSLQGIGSQRWYGGVRATTQIGGRVTIQRDIGQSQRAGLTLDVRHNNSGFTPDYNGWSGGLYLSYERVVSRSMIATASLFGRGERLASKASSDREFGFNIGIGGELAHGINAGLSTGLSRAMYDAPLAALSSSPRNDWRINARVYAGLRSVRFLGFSPSVSYSYTRNASSMTLYDSKRSRLAFDFARYF